MRKILLIVILFSLQGYSQKYFEFYNATGQPVIITNLVADSANSYPEIHSLPFGPITVAPNSTYTLQNTTREYTFPFDSPTSSPYINIWRMVTPSSFWNISALDAWLTGHHFDFSRMTFSIGGNSYTINTTNTMFSPLIGAGFTAEYDEFTAPAPSNEIIYSVVIY